MAAFEKSCANCGRYHCDHLDSDWPDFCMTTNNPREIFDEALDEYRNDPMTRKIFQAAAECEGLYYGALYQHGMYYRRIMQPGFPPERPRTGKGAQP